MKQDIKLSDTKNYTQNSPSIAKCETKCYLLSNTPNVVFGVDAITDGVPEI